MSQTSWLSPAPSLSHRLLRNGATSAGKLPFIFCFCPLSGADVSILLLCFTEITVSEEIGKAILELKKNFLGEEKKVCFKGPCKTGNKMIKQQLEINLYTFQLNMKSK